jgi:hypothetical protein
MDTVANGIKRTISDNRNTGSEENCIGDLVIQNGTHKS